MDIDIKFSLTLITSCGALIFSFLNFKRNKRIENENYLYKLKHEIYAKLLGELSNIINEIENNYNNAELYLKDPSNELEIKLNEHASKLDDLCLLFSDFFINNSLVIPIKILDELGDFCNKILDSDSLDSDVKEKPESLEVINKLIDEIVLQADGISTLLRNDLHIDQLNQSLYRRLN